jgi:hypothetical protein
LTGLISITLRDATLLVALALVLLLMQTPRAARIFRAGAGGADASKRAAEQHDLLKRLDEAERIAREQGIGRRAIRAAFGRMIGPGLPAEVESLDAADLLDVPWEGQEMDSVRVRALLDDSLNPRHR